jgi:GNAT superfamily N-acetyltransferase
MVLKIVKNEEKYYEFIRELRTHEDNISGFLEKVNITPEQQKKYMEKHKDNYYICLNDNNEPVGWVGVVEDDIRVCTHPNHKGKGIGKFMVLELMDKHPKSQAKVLLGNTRSDNLFLSCGFVRYKSDSNFNYYKLVKYNKPKHNPYKIVQMFEEEVANYTGSKYAVSVDSCTNALFLCLEYYKLNHILTKNQYSNSDLEIEIPSKTYLSVPQSIIHAGLIPVFNTNINDWQGIYQLGKTGIYDSAKRFTSNMYIQNSFMCLSFHIKKHIKIGKGGMILTNDADAVEWFKAARYEGRSEKLYHEDDIKMLGWNMYMTPQEASHGLALMQNYPLHVPDLGENNGYRDLTEFTVFKKYKKI